MSIVTVESVSLRAAIVAQRDALAVILRRYRATNPRLFGSVARGDATRDSDIDLLEDLLPGGGNDLLGCLALGRGRRQHQRQPDARRPQPSRSGASVRPRGENVRGNSIS